LLLDDFFDVEKGLGEFLGDGFAIDILLEAKSTSLTAYLAE
jgi:hypothetical protein